MEIVMVDDAATPLCDLTTQLFDESGKYVQNMTIGNVLRGVLANPRPDEIEKIFVTEKYKTGELIHRLQKTPIHFSAEDKILIKRLIGTRCKPFIVYQIFKELEISAEYEPSDFEA